MENPVGTLNEYCQRHGLNFSFDCERLASLSLTRCVLTITSPTPTNPSPATEESESKLFHQFEGNGKNEKEAKRVCSSMAVEALQMNDGLPEDDPMPSLSEVIQESLTPEKLWKDPCFHAYLSLSVEERGWIPIRILSVSKLVSAQVQRGFEHKISVREINQSILHEFLSSSVEGMELSVDQKWISLPSPQLLESYSLEEKKEDEFCKAALLPVDTQLPPEEVELDSKCGLLRAIADQLEIPKEELSVVQTVGPKSLLIKQISPVNPEYTVSLNGDVFGIEILEKTVKSTEIRAPSLWNHDTDSRKNLRASWLAGQAVYGNAVLTVSRPTRDTESGSFMMKWRHFSLLHCWNLVETRLPNRLHNASLLNHLPGNYSSEWNGSIPSYMLNLYLKNTARKMKLIESSTEDCCEMKISVVEDGIEGVGSGEDVETAREVASLQLLHRLYTLDSQLWFTSPQKENTTSLHEIDVVVLEPGQTRQPSVAHGHRVRIQYRLFLSTSPSSGSLIDFDDKFIFDVEGESFLTQAVLGLHPNGLSKTSFTLRLQGEIREVCLFVRMLGFAGIMDTGIKLFSTPMSEQRMQAVSEVLRKENCAGVLDIGCGEGKLLTHLLTSHLSCSLSYLVGVDISSKALSRAKTTLQGFGLPPELDVSLFCGSLVDCEGFQVEAVAMVEVIEHLDPGPLALVGNVVLGEIKPRVFIVTTPNWEYNKLIHQAGGLSPKKDLLERDGIPFRCSDHRFEWTRQEFRSWATSLAQLYGYTVDLCGIGSLIVEEEILQELRNEGVGHASQMAVFLKDSYENEQQKGKRKNVNNLVEIWSHQSSTAT